MNKKVLKLFASTMCVPTAMVPFVLTSCGSRSYKVDAPTNTTEKIKKTDYSKVFILAGQSNADGVSSNVYLKDKVSEQEYETFKKGFDKVKISYWNKENLPAEKQPFISTNYNCGWTTNYFGIELGFADVFNKNSDEDIYIIKYAVSGSNLNFQWLNAFKQRGKLYNNLITFVKSQMSLIPNGKICGVSWMQGESDGNIVCAPRYYANTKNFVSFLREDLKEYSVDNGFVFVDAGIANNWRHFDRVNASKIDYWKSSPLNGYFSTSENGLKNSEEPAGNPDRAHFDSFSELLLGRWFAWKTIELFNKNN